MIIPRIRYTLIEMKSDIEIVIFDLVGTTIQDTDQVPKAFMSALSSQGIQITQDELAAVRGLSKREAIHRFVELKYSVGELEVERRTREVYEVFCDCLAEEYASRGVGEILGVEETFVWLRQHGVRIAINTGLDRSITHLILTATGWEEEFIQVVVCGDDVSKGRPAPYMIFHAMEKAGVSSVQCVANVGDTIHDLQAGKNAGVRWNIGVLSGAHTRLQLEAEEPTFLIPSLAELLGLWDQD
jgi:phosphonatase-like hydrolase